MTSGTITTQDQNGDAAFDVNIARVLIQKNLLIAGPGIEFPCTAVQGNPEAGRVRQYVRNDINVAGAAANDVVLRWRLANGTEGTIATIVTDGGCP